MRNFAGILITCLVLFGSCAKSHEKAKINTASGVARVWLESYYHSNDYELAKSYSTLETAAMIDTIKGLIFPDQENTEPLPFKIVNVRCTKSNASSATECTCTYTEAESTFTENLILVQQKGQWLVDAIDESEDMLEDKEIEKMTKDFELTLDRMLEQ